MTFLCPSLSSPLFPFFPSPIGVHLIIVIVRLVSSYPPTLIALPPSLSRSLSPLSTSIYSPLPPHPVSNLSFASFVGSVPESSMATEVSSWGRTLSGYKKETGEKKEASEKRVVTFDFLVGSPVGVGSRDSNLDFQVSPFASENLLDIRPKPTPARRQIQDLNLPPLPEGADGDGTTPPPQGFAAQDLNVVAPVPSEHRSFCTIEFVKLALERFERKSGGKPRQGRMDGSPSSSPSLAATNSSIKRRWSQEGAVGGADGSDWIFGSLMAAGCPNCFFYVMVPWQDPRCPNCCSHVPVPAIYKKHRVRF